MNRWLKEVFTYSRGERNGLLVMVAIILILIFARLLMPYFVHPPVYKESAVLSMSHFADSLRSVDTYRTDTFAGVFDRDEMPELFPFDPNKASDEEFSALGLTTYQRNNIRKFLFKGGKFLHNEDLKRIYGISADQYNRLESYIHITALFDSAQFYRPPHQKVAESNHSLLPINIEINSADSLQLIAVRGIGPILAGRIIKYRDKLGGYYMADQLLEVYGLKPENFQMIRPFLTVDSSKIRPLDLNTISLKELEAHPYIDRYQAQAIIKYRQLQTRFSKVEEVLEYKLLTPDKYQKIKPYLRTR